MQVEKGDQMKILRTGDRTFKRTLNSITNRSFTIESNVEKSVHRIIKRVREEGDKAVFEFTRKYDNYNLNRRNIKISRAAIEKSCKKLQPFQIDALKIAAQRIRTFHEKQMPPQLVQWKEGNNYLKKVFTPLKRVGVYVPGGKAAYPSTVLMNVIPARVAGVKEIIMVTPPGPDGTVNPAVLCAAHIAGVDSVYRVGGAQAIAALAFGTNSIPKVDKIVGPGNIFVATAKNLLSHMVGTDLFAGPSELVVLAHESARPDFIASDLLSQAEHDEMAVTVLIATSRTLINSVRDEIVNQLNRLKTREIASISIKHNNYLIEVKNWDEAVDIVNAIAPEHLEIIHPEAEALARQVRNAGTIFIGQWTPEPIGDYMAGSNHVLPTGGTARFASGLSVTDFIKSTNIIFFNRKKLRELYLPAAEIARMEGLHAHERSLLIRFEE